VVLDLGLGLGLGDKLNYINLPKFLGFNEKLVQFSGEIQPSYFYL